MTVSGHSFVEFKFAGGQWVAGARKEIFRRLIAAGEHLKGQIQTNISVASNTRPSREGEYPHADMGQLRNSIYRTTDEGTLTTIVGTADKKARWLEFGRRGGKIITPKNAKMLAIELTRQEAIKIANKPQYYLKGTRGKVLKRGNSLRARMARAGIKRNKRSKRKRGQYILLRAKVTQGPIRPRPFFRRTVAEQKDQIARIMNRPIKVPLQLKVTRFDAGDVSGGVG